MIGSTLQRYSQFFKKGFACIVFPNVCLCCGLEVTERENQICSFCINERFEDANPDNLVSSTGNLLPEGVLFQHALWHFDKGGLLQNLLHQLKYERMTRVGRQIGNCMAFRVLKHPGIASLLQEMDSILVPVPLHYLKFMRRGFNQAYMIATGIGEVLDIPICGIKEVVRSKNTRTQTGFNLKKRYENLRDAFKVREKTVFRDRMAIIVDDVFTTGATSFELARILKETGVRGTVILTAAQA